MEISGSWEFKQGTDELIKILTASPGLGNLSVHRHPKPNLHSNSHYFLLRALYNFDYLFIHSLKNIHGALHIGLHVLGPNRGRTCQQINKQDTCRMQWSLCRKGVGKCDNQPGRRGYFRWKGQGRHQRRWHFSWSRKVKDEEESVMGRRGRASRQSREQLLDLFRSLWHGTPLNSKYTSHTDW